MNTKSKIALTFNLLLLLLVLSLLLSIIYLNTAPDFESALRAQLGDAFFDDLSADLPPADQDVQELDALIAKYEPHFLTLNDRAVNRLEELYTAALKEYEEGKIKGTFNRLQLSRKYIQAGRLLENQVDSSFYSLLNHMEQELNNKNLPTAIIKTIEDTYLENKEAKKKELFTRLRTYLQN